MNGKPKHISGIDKLECNAKPQTILPPPSGEENPYHAFYKGLSVDGDEAPISVNPLERAFKGTPLRVHVRRLFGEEYEAGLETSDKIAKEVLTEAGIKVVMTKLFREYGIEFEMDLRTVGFFSIPLYSYVTFGFMRALFYKIVITFIQNLVYYMQYVYDHEKMREKNIFAEIKGERTRHSILAEYAMQAVESFHYGVLAESGKIPSNYYNTFKDTINSLRIWKTELEFAAATIWNHVNMAECEIILTSIQSREFMRK